MSLLIDIAASMSSDLPFTEAIKRARCIRRNHIDDQSIAIEKARFESHPKSNSAFVYTANLKCCSNCGVHYLDTGLEFAPVSVAGSRSNYRYAGSFGE